MHPIHRIALSAALLCSSFAGVSRAEEVVTLATYNIEHFQEHFFAHELTKKLTKEQKADPNISEMLAALRKANDEDNWETAQVITDREVNPDIIVIEEGCTQDNLEYFNKRWLREAYETVLTFETNTGERNQNLNMMLKKGFKVVRKSDQHYLEKDTAANGRGDRLFARGPAFVLVETPTGYKFWVGVTHQKSKRLNFDADAASAVRKEMSGQPKATIDAKIETLRTASGKEAAEWRVREAKRTHEIMKELAASPESNDVILLGDMNDDLGQDEYEKMINADAIETLIGPKADNFILVTQPLADKKMISFGGYMRDFYRSLIDHAVATPAMKDQIVDVKVFQSGLAPVASDHYPVIVKIKSDAKK